MKNQLKELLVLHFLNDGVRTTLVILLPFISKDLSLSLTQAGFLGSSQPLIAAAIALPTGFIIGKFGGFRIILTLLLLYSLAAIGISFSFNVLVLFCVYLLASLGFGMFHTVGFSLTAKASTPTDVGRNMGNFTSIGEIGRVALPPLAVFIASVIGWRPTLTSIGAIGCLLFVAFRLIKLSQNMSRPSEETTQQSHTEFFADIISVFRQKQAQYITVAAIIDSFASSPIYVFLPFLLLHKGINPLQLSIAMGCFFVGSLIGKSLLGRSVDRLGNLKVFMVSEICMAVSLLLIVVVSPFIFLLLLATLLGIFTKGTSPVVQTMFSELSDKEHYHKVFAVSELAIGLAAFVTIVAMGALADIRGINIIFYLSAGLAILATVPIYAFSKRNRR